MTDIQTFAENYAPRLIALAIVIGLSIFILKVSKKVFNSFKEKHPDIQSDRVTAFRVVYSIVQFAIILIAILWGLQICGVNISGAIAGFGVATAIGALAVQDLLKDLIMGMTIVTEKYFSIDDVVEYEGFKGTIVGLTMRSTKIKSMVDGSVRTIANHNISDITVMSHLHDMIVPLSYDMKLQDVHDLFDEIVTQVSELPEIESCLFKGTQEFGESSINYMLRYYCDPHVLPDTKRAVNMIVQSCLEEAGISIPYNQLDVHQIPVK